MRCGFVGLGSQGAPIARRIVEAGYPLMLWARRPQAVEPFRDTPAVIAGSLSELAHHCIHIGICVTDDDAVMDVCGQLIPVMKPGARIAIHSTIHPQTCRAIAQMAMQGNITVLDAPVSGGAPAAKAGALVVMVGGSQDALDVARPLFETFASLIVHMGGIGAGQMAKIINNSLMAANLALAHSALQTGSHLQLVQSALGEILAAGSGRSFALEVCRRRAANRTFTQDSTLKDKVRLLGSLLGEDDCAYRAIRDAALPNHC